MSEDVSAKEINNLNDSFFHAEFSDESVFILPKDWEAVFMDCFGPNQKNYPIVADRLRFIIQKYKNHNSYPSKFDGLGMEEDELESIAVFDNPNYYFGDPIVDNSKYDKHLTKKHTMAEIAMQLLYVAMRPGLVQQALQNASKEQQYPLVIGTKQMQKEIDSEENFPQPLRVVIDPSSILKHLTPYISWPRK